MLVLAVNWCAHAADEDEVAVIFSKLRRPHAESRDASCT